MSREALKRVQDHNECAFDKHQHIKRKRLPVFQQPKAPQLCRTVHAPKRTWNIYPAFLGLYSRRGPRL